MTDDRPLAGFTVGITADRRRDELAALVERRGARVVLAPALRIMPLGDDGALRAATLSLVDTRPDVVVATTAIGFRGWLEAADGWGLADRLKTVLAGTHLIARGPKVRGAIRAAGLTDHWAPDSESCDEILDRLLTEGVRGRRIAVQVHGEEQPDFCGALVAGGADVVEVAVYRRLPPADPEPLRRLVELTVNRLVDAVTFTSVPAVDALMRFAGPDLPALRQALRTDVLAACVGPVTAAALHRHDVFPVVPARARLGALVRTLVEELPKHATTLRIAGREVTVRGHAVLVDGEVRPLAPGPMAVLRALAGNPGRVLPRRTLLAALPRGTEEHAVEVAVARLRTALGDADFVQTVVKRGYRLRTD